MDTTTNGSSPVVSLRNVRKTYPHPTRPVEALRGVDMTIRGGEVVAVMGASGSGKSTLLHIAAGLDRPDSGEVIVGGHDLSTMSDRELTLFRRRRVGVVFQFFNLVPTLTAIENVMLPMALDGADRKAMLRRGRELMDLVGLGDRADHRPDALSGGEQQRVAVARALLMDPDIVLADEPTGNLDSDNAAVVWSLLGSLAGKMGKALCVVTHESSVAAQADRVRLIKDGRIVGELDAAEIRHDPSLVASRYQELAR
jgi:putative ABC transport system ATP-binding protein